MDYINSKATALCISVLGLLSYGIYPAVVSCIFHYVGISLNWLNKILGCLLGDEIIPIAFVLLWNRTLTFAAIISPIIRLISALTSWIVALR